MIEEELKKFNDYKTAINAYQEILSPLGGGLGFFTYNWSYHQNDSSFNSSPEHIKAGQDILNANSIIEKICAQDHFKDIWNNFDAKTQQSFLHFSPESYLSVRKRVPLSDLRLEVMGHIKSSKEFSLYHYRLLHSFVKNVLNITFMETLGEKNKLALKEKLEEKTASLFPNFKASKSNTIDNLYINLLNLSILKEINSKEENAARVDFSPLQDVSFSEARHLHGLLQKLVLFDLPGLIFSHNIVSFSFYENAELDIQTELNNYLNIIIEKNKLETNIKESVNAAPPIPGKI